jgi:hypothetical protein
MMRLLLLALALAACGSSNPPTPDAARTTGAGFGSACTVVSDTSTECTTGVCTDSFNMLGDVCSVKCTLLNMTDPACPTGSMGQKCNMKGYCRP